MVKIPPYLPSAGWYKDWLKSIAEGADDSNSVVYANVKGKVARELSRTFIKDSSNRDLILSIAVEGGARQLRVPDKIKEVYLSEHGNWRHNHLNAIIAAYGKKPFFIHIYPDLKNIYEDLSLIRLEDFNNTLHRLLSDWLINSLDRDYINLFHSNPVLMERGRELATGINREISLLDAIMNYGREAILGILSL